MRLPKFPLKASIRVNIFVDWSSHTRYRFRFWLAVQDLKRQPLQDVPARAQEIWQEFLAEGAPSSINLDSHSFERTSQNLKDPGRYSFEDAQVMVVPCFSHTVWSTRLQNSYTVWRQTVSSISLFRGQFLFTVRSSVNAFQHTLHLSSPSISGAHIHTHEKWQLCTLFAIRHLPRPPVCQKEGEPSFPADLDVFDFPWTIGFDCFFSLVSAAQPQSSARPTVTCAQVTFNTSFKFESSSNTQSRDEPTCDWMKTFEALKTSAVFYIQTTKITLQD